MFNLKQLNPYLPKLFKISKSLLTVILTLYFIRKHDFETNIIISITSIVSVLLIFSLINFISSYKQTLILDSLDTKIQYSTYTIYHWASSFVTAFLPSFIFGDAYKVIAISKDLKVSKKILSKCILIDRLGTLILTFLSAAFIFSLLLYSKFLSSVVILALTCTFFSVLFYLVKTLFNLLGIKKNIKKILLCTGTIYFLRPVMILILIFDIQGIANMQLFFYSTLSQSFEHIPLTIFNIGIGHYFHSYFLNMSKSFDTNVIYDQFLMLKIISKVLGVFFFIKIYTSLKIEKTT